MKNFELQPEKQPQAEAALPLDSLRNKIASLGTVAAIGVGAFGAASSAEAGETNGERVWFTGQGTDSIEVCEDDQDPYLNWVLTAGGAQSTVETATLYVDHNLVGEFNQRGEGAFQKTTRYFGLEADIWADTDGQTGPGQANLVISEGCEVEEPKEEEPEEEKPKEEEPKEEEPEEEKPKEEEPKEKEPEEKPKDEEPVDKPEDVTVVTPPAVPIETEPDFTG